MCEQFAWCPNWEPGSGNWDERFGNPDYDFGVVWLAPRVGDEADAGKVVQQFEVEWDLVIEEDMEREMLACPYRSDNHLERMMVQPDDFYECDDNCVKKTCLDPVLGGGASGGVWLLDYGGRKVANGVPMQLMTVVVLLGPHIPPRACCLLGLQLRLHSKMSRTFYYSFVPVDTCTYIPGIFLPLILIDSSILYFKNNSGLIFTPAHILVICVSIALYKYYNTLLYGLVWHCVAKGLCESISPSLGVALY